MDLNKLMTRVKEAQKEYELAQHEEDQAKKAVDKASSLYFNLNNIAINKKYDLNRAEEKLLKFVKG